MRQDVLRNAEKYTKVHKRKRLRHRVVTVLAGVVVFCTTYALILPAITLEKQCDIPEHTHTDACYAQVTSVEKRVPVCSAKTLEIHQHTADCYDANGNPTCGYADFVVHSHDSRCYDENGNLWCPLPEIEAHRHTDSCFDADGNLICGQTQILEHQHSDACFETVAEPVDTGKLVCGQEEHTHSKACTAVESEEPVFCGKDAHTHGEACRDENGELVCGTEEHTHSLACYADPTADVETAELWEQTFAGVTLTGNWRQDTLAIAETQLGYAESTKNYVVAEDGETVKGYTRYGAWCEEPYGDWNTMFLTFCLHYAGVEGVPPDRDCGGWVTSWADAFEPAQSHTPAVGDLVLFDRDGDGTADRAGLVAQVTDSGFAAMEGDAEDAVRLLTYGADDPGILGYINLPEGPKEFTLTAQTETGITVTITGESASLPYPAREITATATEVTDGERRTIRDQILGEEQAEPERSYLLDITLWHGEEEIEPTGSVTVTFSGIDTEGLYPKVYHIDTNAQTATDMEAEKTETGDVAVATDHFSMYDISLVAAKELSSTSTIGEDTFKDGGEFQLTGDVRTGDSINKVTISRDTTIDLNGHTLTISKSGQCFEVQSSATLTIKDSQAPEETVSDASGDVYGHVATLNGNTLTYYITESTPNATGTAGTTEKLKKHEVTLSGAILCEQGSDQAIKVNNGGTLDIQSGVLRNSNGKRVVQMENGTLNMTGGYIVGGGNNNYDNGGGVYAKNGTLNISGGVIAANSGTKGGGICMEGGFFTMRGGVISGNQTKGGASTGHLDTGLGGGVFAQDTTVTISGGHITNNRENAKCEQNGYGCHGGGGIATIGGSLAMEGGFVTGNYSKEAGGGMYIGHFNQGRPVTFTMSGGIVAGNVADTSEGGGIRVSGGTTGTIRTSERVYITNNVTNTPFDWGGGGIFVQTEGNLTIMDALITNNHAEGFGGGVGACPTGKTLIVNQAGAAIYGNAAKGEQMSGGGDGKNYDSTVAGASPVFMANGYKDYFCVRDSNGANDPISLVTGQMAGGGAANWKGSCDKQPVTIGPSGYAAAKYLFGLSADPSPEDITKAATATNVIITGNRSHIHGGGIMTNGGLILGDPGDTKVVTATPELDIIGTKALTKDGEKQNEGLNFQFKLTDSDGKEVGTAKADAATGKFTISPNVQYTEAGTYTYTLSEVNDNRPGITYDTNVHTIQVTISEKTVTLLDVKFTSYNVASVKLDGSESGGSSGSGSGTGSETGTFKVHFKNTDSWNDVYMYVWNGDNRPLGEWPGKPMTKDTDGTYHYDLTVTGTGNYNYIFNNNNSGKKTEDITNVSYEPGKEVWFDYDPVTNKTAVSGSSGSGDAVGQGSNADGSYTLTIPGAAFTNTMTTQLNLQITKKDSVDDSKLLKDAEFTLTRVGTENTEGSLTGTTATTGKDGIATFAGIRRNTTYYLRETQAPSNYMTAGPWILEVGNEDATLYPATENQDGTLKIAGEGTQLTVSDTDTKVLSVTVRDISWGYELPNTGGAGTTSYTAGGLALIFGAATLLYSHCRRRKEDEASS